MDLIEKQKYQGCIVSGLVALAFFLTYYFENILVTNQIYTHFY